MCRITFEGFLWYFNILHTWLSHKLTFFNLQNLSPAPCPSRMEKNSRACSFCCLLNLCCSQGQHQPAGIPLDTTAMFWQGRKRVGLLRSQAQARCWALSCHQKWDESNHTTLLKLEVSNTNKKYKRLKFICFGTPATGNTA